LKSEFEVRVCSLSLKSEFVHTAHNQATKQPSNQATTHQATKQPSNQATTHQATKQPLTKQPTVLPEYKLLLERSTAQRKETKSLFEKLRKMPGRELDEMVHQFHDEAFEEIDCLKCANCCRGTGPLLKNKDIDKLSAELRKKPADFVQEYLRIDEDNDYVFKSMPCPFLKDDNYCKVYSARPNACAQFPHTDQRDIRSILSITLLNSMICPAVAKVVEKLKAEASENLK
jgi:hypothetical protein